MTDKKQETKQIKNSNIIDLSGLETFNDEISKKLDGVNLDFKDNDIVHGVVAKIEHDEVFVDIGFKSEGIISSKELTVHKDCNPEEVISVGDEVDALVVQKEDKDGKLILSRKRAMYETAWAQAEEKYKSGEIVTGDVIEIVRGGLILDIGLRAFLPASLVDLHRVRDLESYLGTRIEARIIEMDKVRNNIVLSRRALLEEGRRNERIDVLSKLTPGMKLKGKISSIVDFGAFVDLGGIDGLVHISEISWDRVSHPSEVVKVGDEVETVVLGVDLDKERISLGIKQTTEDPWLKLVEEFKIGNIVECEVTRILSYGAFVKLNNDVDGLVHVSELTSKHIENPGQVVHIGDKIKAKVIDIDESKHRVSLSLKDAAQELGFEVEVSEPLPKNMKKRDRKSTIAANNEDSTSTSENNSDK